MAKGKKKAAFDYTLPAFNGSLGRQRLIEFRRALNITQERLAGLADVSQPLISKIEQGGEFTEPYRSRIWNAIFKLVEEAAQREGRKMADSSPPLDPSVLRFPFFKTPMEQKDEEIALLTKERDLAREQYSTVKQLLDMNLVDRCVELEKQLAAALQANADYAKLFALKGSAVAGDELQGQIEARLTKPEK